MTAATVEKGRPGVRTGPKCGRPKASNREPCKAPAGYRTDHPGQGPCNVHGGNTPGMRTKYARERVAAAVAEWQASNAFPGMVDATASGPEVLLRALSRQEATVAWIRAQIARWALPTYTAKGEDVDLAELAELLPGDRTGMFDLVAVHSGGEGTPAAVGESERAAWMRTLFDWETLLAKTSAKVSQLGIQEDVVRLMAAQAVNLEAVLMGAMRRLGLDEDGEGVRAAVAAAIREDVGSSPRPLSLQGVQGRGRLTA